MWSQRSPLGTAATNKPIVPAPSDYDDGGNLVVVGETLPQCRFVHHKPHMLPGCEPGPPRWEASDQVNFFFLICAGGLWVLRPLTGLLYQSRMIGDGDCGEIGGTKIGRGNRSIRRKPAPTSLYLPHIAHD
jgi:hypothetical protein